MATPAPATADTGVPDAGAVPPRGACPSVERPFEAADRLLVRVRVPGGELSTGQLTAVAAAAAEHGSGTVELTSRANLQIRGLAPEGVAPLRRVLAAAGLARPDAPGSPDDMGADHDAPGAPSEGPDVLVAPAAGVDASEVLDVRPLALAVVAALGRMGGADAPALHPKAGVLVDGGGRISLRGRSHDVCLGAARRADTGETVIEVTLGEALPPEARTAGTAAGPALVVRPDAAGRAAATALVLAAKPPGGPAGPDGPMRVSALVASRGLGAVVAEVERISGATLERIDPGLLRRATPVLQPPLGPLPHRRPGVALVGAAPVLGRVDAGTLADVAALARRHACEAVRLTPWRGLLLTGVPAATAAATLVDLADLGLTTSPDDPAASVVACAGSAGCVAGEADTQADGRELVARLRAAAAEAAGPPPSIHLSGCPKRCASRRLHDVTLVAVPGGVYDVHVADPSSPTGERCARRGVPAEAALEP